MRKKIFVWIYSCNFFSSLIDFSPKSLILSNFSGIIFFNIEKFLSVNFFFLFLQNFYQEMYIGVSIKIFLSLINFGSIPKLVVNTDLLK